MCADVADAARSRLRGWLDISRSGGAVVQYRSGREPAFLMNHPKAIRHVLQTNARNYTKETRLNQAFRKGVVDGLLTSEGSAWARQRHLMNPPFRANRVSAFVPLIAEAAREAVSQWHSLARNEVIDIAAEMGRISIEVTGRAILGVRIGDRSAVLNQVVTDWLHLIPTYWKPECQRAVASLRSQVEELIRERRERPDKDAHDLLAAMIRDSEAGEQDAFSEAEIREQVLTLILAGHDTTAAALSCTWYELARNPHIRKRLYEEVDEVLGGQPIVASQLPRLTYTRRVFEETLRLYPPGWVIGRKAIADDVVEGVKIPAGSTVAVSPFTMQRHPDYWDRPDEFDPDRFLPERSSRRDRFTYLPFGLGPRTCVGNSFVMVQSAVVFTTIASAAVLELVEGAEVSPRAKYVLIPRGRIPMTVGWRHQAQNGKVAAVTSEDNSSERLASAWEGNREFLGLRLRYVRIGDCAISDWTAGPAQEGFPGMIHGSVLASIFDDLIGWLSWHREGRPMVCAKLGVRYLKPTPIGISLRLKAEVSSRRGRLLTATAWATLPDGVKTAQAEATYVAVPIDLLEKMKRLEAERNGAFVCDEG